MAVDADLFLTQWTTTETGVRSATEAPAEDDWPVDGLLNVVRRVGGPTLAKTLDLATVVVDTFGPTRRQTLALATQVRDLYANALKGQRTEDGFVVNKVDVDSGPAWGPNANQIRYHLSSTFSVLFHGV